jgi:hypothetical protein
MQKQILRLGVLVLAAMAAACGTDQPTAPQPSALRAPVIKNPPVLTGALTREQPLAEDITVSKTIGSEGGVLEIPETGLKLTVPQNAVSKPTTFTATALKGSVVAYDFGPAGATFMPRLWVEQSLSGTTWYNIQNPMHLQGAYFADAAQLDQQRGRAFVNEILQTFVNIGQRKVTFPVSHFSGYMVASGTVRR